MADDIKNKILECIDTQYDNKDNEAFLHAKKKFKKIIDNLSGEGDEKIFIDTLNEIVEERDILKNELMIQLSNIGRIENINQVVNFLDNPFSKVSNLVADRSVKKIEDFNEIGSKDVGVCEGFIAEPNYQYGYLGQQFMIKNFNSTQSFVACEYIAAPLFSMLLYNKAPEIQIVTDNNSGNYIRSKYLDAYSTFSNLLLEDNSNVNKVIGLEKVFATSFALGDDDCNGQNIVVLCNTDTDKYEAAKIDHGRAFHRCYTYAHQMLIEIKHYSKECEIDPSKFIKHFSDAIQFLNLHEIVDEIVNERIMNLQKFNISLDKVRILHDGHANNSFIYKEFCDFNDDEIKMFEDLYIKLYLKTEGIEDLPQLFDKRKLIKQDYVNLKNKTKKNNELYQIFSKNEKFNQDYSKDKYDYEMILEKLLKMVNNSNEKNIDEKCLSISNIACKYIDEEIVTDEEKKEFKKEYNCEDDDIEDFSMKVGECYQRFLNSKKKLDRYPKNIYENVDDYIKHEKELINLEKLTEQYMEDKSQITQNEKVKKVTNLLNYKFLGEYIKSNIKNRINAYENIIEEIKIMEKYTDLKPTDDHLDESQINRINISVNGMKVYDPILSAIFHGWNILKQCDDGKYIVRDTTDYAKEIDYFKYDRIKNLINNRQKSCTDKEKEMLQKVFDACSNDVKSKIRDDEELSNTFELFNVNIEENQIEHRGRIKRINEDIENRPLDEFDERRRKRVEMEKKEEEDGDDRSRIRRNYNLFPHPNRNSPKKNNTDKKSIKKGRYE